MRPDMRNLIIRKFPIRFISRKMSIEGKLEYPDGQFIFYKQRKGINKSKPGVIFCSGYDSDIDGRKPQYLDKYCSDKGLSYLRFDYFGHNFIKHQFTF